MKIVRFGIIGCGRIFPKHAEAICNIKSAKLIAVCDVDEKKLNKAARKYKCDKYLDYKEMLKEKNIDVISICTPSGMHYVMALDCAKARKHIVVEKPMALDLRQAKLIVSMCKFCRLKLFVVKQNRYNKPIIKLKEVVEKGRLGKLFLGNACVRWSRSNSYYDQDEWRGSRAQDGSVFYNQAAHFVDMLCWILGPVKSVVGFCENMTHKTIEVEDTGVAILKFKSGAIATIEATTSIYNKNLEGSITVLGTKGSVKVGGTSMNKIEVWNIKGRKEDIKKFNENPKNIYGFGHKRYYEDVIKCIKQDIEPIVGGEEGIKSLKVIEAIYESIRLGGKEVEIK